MSGAEPPSDATPFFSDESEAEGPEEPRGGTPAQLPEAEPPSGVSRKRALLTVCILCYVNLLNYMDRFTVAGRPQPIRGSAVVVMVMKVLFDHLTVKPATRPGVLPDIERDFGINDKDSGLLQTGERTTSQGQGSGSASPRPPTPGQAELRSPPANRKRRDLQLSSNLLFSPQSSSAVTCFWLRSSVT